MILRPRQALAWGQADLQTTGYPSDRMPRPGVMRGGGLGSRKPAPPSPRS